MSTTRQDGSALVTGASRGIGAATARALSAEGWPVAVNFRADEAGAREVAAGIVDAGGRAEPVRSDVSDPTGAERAVDAAAERLGPVLVLVNNAGVRADGLAPQIGDEAWDRVLDTNLSGAFRTTRRALPTMLRARFGRVINIASVVGPRANAGQANYAASKAGLIGFSKAVAREVASRQITVNVVAPGLVATDMTQALTDRAQGDWSAQIPLGRVGTPEDVAAAVCFLASDEASYITGQVLAVNGGMYT